MIAKSFTFAFENKRYTMARIKVMEVECTMEISGFLQFIGKHLKTLSYHEWP